MTHTHWLGGCDELRAATGLAVRCCDSCHSDDYANMNDFSTPRSEYAVWACCSWNDQLDDETVPWEKLKAHCDARLPEESQANAELIVRAVNALDEAERTQFPKFLHCRCGQDWRIDSGLAVPVVVHYDDEPITFTPCNPWPETVDVASLQRNLQALVAAAEGLLGKLDSQGSCHACGQEFWLPFDIDDVEGVPQLRTAIKAAKGKA